MNDIQEIIDSAAEALAEDGEPVQFSYTTGGSYNPETGGDDGGTVVIIDANGYPSAYKNNERSGSVIESGDIRLICEKLTERPQQGWDCTVDNNTYRVEDVQPIRKSGADIIYICQLRK